MGMKWERWAPANGILFVVAFVVAFFVAGEPPKIDEGAAALRTYYADDGAILTSTYVVGIALVLYLSFLGTLATRVREAGQARLATVVFAAGITTSALYMVCTLANATLAYRTPADDGVLQALYDLQLVGFVLIAFPSALLVGSVALASSRARIFSRWFDVLAAIAALGFLVGGAAFASDGWFAPGGAYGLVATFAFLAWTATASAMLTMQAETSEAPQPVTAM